jgi:hypothetical protein
MCLIIGENMMHLKKTALRISMLLFLVMIVLATGGVLYLASERGSLDMKQSAFASDTVSSQPLIDTQVPKHIATATFAMG